MILDQIVEQEKTGEGSEKKQSRASAQRQRSVEAGSAAAEEGQVVWPSPRERPVPPQQPGGTPRRRSRTTSSRSSTACADSWSSDSGRCHRAQPPGTGADSRVRREIAAVHTSSANVPPDSTICPFHPAAARSRDEPWPNPDRAAGTWHSFSRSAPGRSAAPREQ